MEFLIFEKKKINRDSFNGSVQMIFDFFLLGLSKNRNAFHMFLDTQANDKSY